MSREEDSRKYYLKNRDSMLKKQDFPEGYQTLCMNCQWIKRFENNEIYRGLKL